MNHQVEDIQFSFSKSNRRTASLFVERDGSVSMIVPEQLSLDDVEGIIKQKKAWIYRSLAEWQDLNASRVNREFVSGETFLYLGRGYKLKVASGLKADLVLKDGHFLIKDKKLHACANVFKTFYREKGKAKISERVAYYQGKAGVRPGDIKVMELGHRWASCSPDGSLNFHWKCMMAPLSILDYIIVHELCHLHHLNHNDAFWNEVDKVLPDYRNRREWLKINGASFNICDDHGRDVRTQLMEKTS
jgi:hypothetical protein